MKRITIKKYESILDFETESFCTARLYILKDDSFELMIRSEEGKIISEHKFRDLSEMKKMIDERYEVSFFPEPFSLYDSLKEDIGKIKSFEDYINRLKMQQIFSLVAETFGKEVDATGFMKSIERSFRNIESDLI